MTAPPLTELSARAREIFALVVDSYFESGQPVGSKALAQDERVDLSSASIRAVMAELETLGLLAAPHTSAGRLPTTKGLRLFVDGMMQVGELSAEEQAEIQRRLGNGGPVEAALEKTSALLSDLTSGAGLVTVPRREPRLTQMSIVPLSDRQALAVLVGDDGLVENRLLDLPAPLASNILEQASNYVTAQLQGRTLPEAIRAIEGDIRSGRTALDEASRDLVRRGLAVWSEDASERPVLIVRGAANLLDDAALADLDRVRTLLDDLESKQSVAALLDHAREADATRIFIGSENRLFSLSGSSVIASPYRDGEGRVVGVLGVIGPTRLNYARIVPMIDFTARSLGKLIG